jgi:ABC-type glycerol-3-phosphate transport system permease component
MEIILLFMRRPLPMNRTFTKKLELSQFLSYFVLLFFCLHIFGIIGCIFGYYFCFAFICSNLMHPHLVFSQHMQLIRLTKNLAPSSSIQPILSKSIAITCLQNVGNIFYKSVIAYVLVEHNVEFFEGILYFEKHDE